MSTGREFSREERLYRPDILMLPKLQVCTDIPGIAGNTFEVVKAEAAI